MEKMKKLKSEIKRLRQELIMKPAGGPAAPNWDLGQDDSFTEEQKQQIRQLPQEQKKLLQELEQSGANKEYVKSKILACINNQDQGFMVDIDLSSFGLPWELFLRDSVAVREEFSHLSDEEFYPKQKGFLESLLHREHFCYTEFFRRRHEDRARTNIQRYLDELAARGLLTPVTPG